jgi:hypothetical protein
MIQVKVSKSYSDISRPRMTRDNATQKAIFHELFFELKGEQKN